MCLCRHRGNTPRGTLRDTPRNAPRRPDRERRPHGVHVRPKLLALRPVLLVRGHRGRSCGHARDRRAQPLLPPPSPAGNGARAACHSSWLSRTFLNLFRESSRLSFNFESIGRKLHYNSLVI